MKTLSATKLSKKLNISKVKLDKTLLSLKYIETDENNKFILTSLGEERGGCYKNSKFGKYIAWNENIELPDLKSNKEKGDFYEKFIADYYKKDGYHVWEHGKEKGVKDSSIDLIVKKDEDIFFIQCKNWKSWKINHKEVKATRTDIREYLKNNPLFWDLIKDKTVKLIYITPKECLTKGAFKYIEENKDIVEYKIIPIETEIKINTDSEVILNDKKINNSQEISEKIEIIKKENINIEETIEKKQVEEENKVKSLFKKIFKLN